MIKRYISIAVIALSFIMVSCDKPETSNSPILQETFTLNNINDIITKVKADTEIKKEEMDLLSNGLVRLAATKDSIIGKTVLDIINMQKDFIRKQSVLFFERTASRVGMAMNHKFHYVGLQPRDADKQMFDIIVFEMTNTSDKEIKTIHGSLQFFTQDNQIVKIYNLKTDQAIKPGEMKRMGNPFIHDPNSQRDQIIRNAKNLKALWNVTLIEFVDGTKMEPINNESNQ